MRLKQSGARQQSSYLVALSVCLVDCPVERDTAEHSGTQRNTAGHSGTAVPSSGTRRDTAGHVLEKKKKWAYLPGPDPSSQDTETSPSNKAVTSQVVPVDKGKKELICHQLKIQPTHKSQTSKPGALSIFVTCHSSHDCSLRSNNVTCFEL